MVALLFFCTICLLLLSPVQGTVGFVKFDIKDINSSACANPENGIKEVAQVAMMGFREVLIAGGYVNKVTHGWSYFSDVGLDVAARIMDEITPVFLSSARDVKSLANVSCSIANTNFARSFLAKARRLQDSLWFESMSELVASLSCVGQYRAMEDS